MICTCMKTLFLIIFFLFFLVVVNADAAVLMRPANNLGLAPLEARAMSAADASRRLASNGASRLLAHERSNQHHCGRLFGEGE